MFWLDARTIGHAVVEGDEDKLTSLYAISVKYDSASSKDVTVSDKPTLIGKFPTSSAANLRYSEKANMLVFSDYVYSDGVIENVKSKDKAWETRGNTANVYDATYVRHWDTWVGPKKSSLFSVSLVKTPNSSWELGTDFVNLLAKATGHVRC